MYSDKNDILADASTYEERNAILRSPSFRFLDADMDRQLEKSKRRNALQERARAKQAQLSFR